MKFIFIKGGVFVDFDSIKESIKNWMNNKNEDERDDSRGKRSNSIIQNLIAIFCIGFLILTFGRFFMPNRPNQSSNQDSIIQQRLSIDNDQPYKQQLENQLSSVLGQVHGLKNIEVMITLEDETETVPAFNTIVNEKTSEEKDNEGGIRTIQEKQTNNEVVILQKSGEQEPMIIKTETPSIRGVLIVAEGVTSSKIERDIIRATATVLGIPVYKIMVLPK